MSCILASTVQMRHLVSRVTSRCETAENLPYIGLEDIEGHTGRLANTHDYPDELELLALAKDAEPFSGTGFHAGDVLFGTLRPYLGKAWVAEFDGVCTTEALVLRPHSIEPRFLRSIILSQPTLDSISASTAGSKMPRADWEFIGSQHVPLPSLDHQYEVADFIDGEVTKIYSIIREHDQLLKLLDEKRRALITNAVIRGLDLNVPLRDSGIPWIGHVPAHWDIWKLGHMATIGNGSTPNRGRSDYWSEAGTPWLNSSIVHKEEATEADQFVTSIALRECHLPMVGSGSVLVAITGQGQTRGKATVLAIDATINQHLAYVTPDTERLDPRYLRWTIFTAYDYLRSISDDTGGTKGALTCEDISNVRVPIPPIREQRAIVHRIATKVKHLAELHQVVEHAIGLLKERRSTLISAAVTGQIEVGKAA